MFSLNAVATLVKMLTGFISVKIVAVLIGPAGIALLGQLNNFSSIFLTISTGGISSGVTKYIAENDGSQQNKCLFANCILDYRCSFGFVRYCTLSDRDILRS